MKLFEMLVRVVVGVLGDGHQGRVHQEVRLPLGGGLVVGTGSARLPSPGKVGLGAVHHAHEKEQAPEHGLQDGALVRVRLALRPPLHVAYRQLVVLPSAKHENEDGTLKPSTPVGFGEDSSCQSPCWRYTSSRSSV